MNYSAAVLSRVRDPKHAGWMSRDAPDVGTGEAGTMEQGTVARIQVRVNRDTGLIGEAVFKVFGCSAAIASASLVAERLRGMPVTTAGEMDALAIVAELELPIERAYLASLAVQAAHAAIEDWKRKVTVSDHD